MYYNENNCIDVKNLNVLLINQKGNYAFVAVTKDLYESMLPFL